MTNRAVVATGGKPTLSSVVMPSEAYGIPPGAQQKGAASLLDAGDDRMQQTSGASVWMATEYVPPKPSQTPDGLRNWGTRVLDLAVH